MKNNFKVFTFDHKKKYVKFIDASGKQIILILKPSEQKLSK